MYPPPVYGQLAPGATAHPTLVPAKWCHAPSSTATPEARCEKKMPTPAELSKMLPAYPAGVMVPTSNQ
jgi:hypothetical protein